LIEVKIQHADNAETHITLVVRQSKILAVLFRKKRPSPKKRKPDISKQEFDELIRQFKDLDFRNRNVIAPVRSGEYRSFKGLKLQS